MSTARAQPFYNQGFYSFAMPPGVAAMPTKQVRSSQWAEVNLMRWVEGVLQPVGGQQQYNYEFASRCKAIHGWYGLNGIYYTAYLCEANLYVDAEGDLFDITPSGGLIPPAYPTGGYGSGPYGRGFQLATTAAFTTGSPNITMTSAASRSILPGQDVFDVTTGQDVGAVLSFDGVNLVLTANALNPGSAGDVLNFGAYGQPRQPSSQSTLFDEVPDAFSLWNFGGILLAMTSPDGRLLQWDPGAGQPGPDNLATPVVADSGRGIVPTGRSFVVTPERFVIVFGAFDADNGGGFRRFAWCDQENFQAWDYSNVTSQAGFLDIEPASPIVTALNTRTGTLFWTGKSAFIITFLGIPYVYNYVPLADNCTPWSPQSAINTSSMALWFSKQGLFSWDGTSVLPVQCAVRGWIDDDIDELNVREQACAVHVSDYNEFWWFFPQLSTGTGYNTRAVIYSYKEGWWSEAQMSRSAGVTAAYNSYTIMADGGVAFQHELGNYYANAALPWAETFDLNLTPDRRLVTVKQMIPDIGTMEISDPTAIANAIGGVRYSLFYRNSRSLGTAEQQSPPVPVRPDGYVDFRTTGRNMRLRFDMTGPAVPLLTFGEHLMDAVPRGDR